MGKWKENFLKEFKENPFMPLARLLQYFSVEDLIDLYAEFWVWLMVRSPSGSLLARLDIRINRLERLKEK